MEERPWRTTDSRRGDRSSMTQIYQSHGVLVGKDRKRHLQHSVVVPEGAESLVFRFLFEPDVVNGVRNMLTLTIFDPDGFRGARHCHGNEHIVEVGPEQATPGYRIGTIKQGEWVVGIDTHMIMDGVPCAYRLEVDAMLSRSFQWYRGDLHCHTDHSDAQWTVAELVASAHGLGLDFLAITDHNTVTAFPEALQLAPRLRNGLVLIPGIELTTFWGHALCLGATEWIDWRVRNDDASMVRLAQTLVDAGKVFVIAHPNSPGDPECTGCRWLYPGIWPDPAHIVEVWNGPWTGDSGNETTLAVWHEWLAQGKRITATAGSDAHSRRDHVCTVGFNVVWAGGRETDYILQAIRHGTLYLSSGPMLTIAGVAEDGSRTMMGGTLRRNDKRIEVVWRDAPAGSRGRVLCDGTVVRQWDCGPEGSASLPAHAISAYCVAEMRDASGAMLALTNPLYS